MKVLVIQQRMGIGDMVIFLPYIHAISKRLRSSVTLLVKENSRAKQLCANDKNINEIIYLERGNKNPGRHDGLSGFLKLVKEIKEKKFDAVYIFNGSLRYLLIAKLCGIKNIYQYPLFTKKDNIVTSAKDFTEKNLGETISTQPNIFLNENEVIEVKKKYNFENKFKHICIGFSASGPTKRWDINNYLRLAETLNNIKPCKFYLCGGQKDQELFNIFLNSSIGKNCVSFKDLEIKNALPIIKNCNAYIGNDTGWLHVSSALGLKCLALFMDSPVMAYGKYSKNISIIVPEGETEETTTHDTLGKDKISFEKVLENSLRLIN
jgi:heptosyltransferase-2